jgi:dephospho-CoA kinase
MIGLTGGIASGKSTVASRLIELGAFVADADIVSREVISYPEVLCAIRSAFGGEVFSEDGELDRRALAAAAFATDEGAALLNSITHPAIVKRLKELAAEAEASGKYRLVFVDAALLIEAGFHTLCEGVWLVTANEDTRIARIMERDGLTRELARDRIARQAPDEEKRAYATVVLENDGTVEELLSAVDLAFYRELFLKDAREFHEIREIYEEQ